MAKVECTPTMMGTELCKEYREIHGSCVGCDFEKSCRKCAEKRIMLAFLEFKETCKSCVHFAYCPSVEYNQNLKEGMLIGCPPWFEYSKR